MPADPGPRAGAGLSVGGADLTPPGTLILVRHGHTDWTGRLAAGGDDDGPALNGPGRAEAAALARTLEATRVICSPTLRTRQTAAPIAAALGVPVEVDQRWAEARFGAWHGLPYRQIAEGWPARAAAWRSSTATAPPGGESFDALALRVGAAADALPAGERIVVVTHAWPIRSLLRRALEAGPAALWRLRIDPSSVSVLRRWRDGGVEVAGVNGVAHLNPLPPGPA